MTLTEFASVASAPGGVMLIILYIEIKRRAGNPQPTPDPIAQKLDAVLDETQKANAAMADLAKSIAVLLDRTPR